MTLTEAQKILRDAAARGRRATFPAPVAGQGNHATLDRHATYGAARH